ncbi:recombinase family protein [Plantactinospora endophytica]|uniref:Serine recombinase n=1 Tax=Plantactinospora endophytica TaxID=673535 RepID=A0ABQ4ECC1_9ACTN|nr:recombinase family protein [Plantactinospora endophytica]GIG92385.1 serine recombinase [Plantactinospora endophytica]
MGKRAVIYARISLDATGEGLGVARQEQACRELCEQRGWQVTAVIVDNSVSASTRKVRPGWRQVLDLITSGAVDVVVAWQVDRMYRNLRDLEDLVDLTERTGVTLATVSGELDLSTPNGRFLARILGSAARQEVEIKSARQKAAQHQRVQTGRPWWTVRPFGFERNGDHRQSEAEPLRQAYADVLTGQSVYSIAARWNAAGILTPKGNRWRSSNLRHVLMCERNAAILTYNGAETGNPATWEPIVPEDVYRATVRHLSEPSRNTGGGGRRKGLLVGVATCSRCGGKASQGWSKQNQAGERYRIYTCREGRCITIPADWLDSYVLRRLINQADQWNVQPVDQEAEQESTQLRVEESAVLARKQSLAELFVAGTVDQAALAAGTAAADSRLTEIRDRLAEIATARVGVDLSDIESVWEAIDQMETERVRTIIETACESIRLMPRRKGARLPRGEDVQLTWRMPQTETREGSPVVA